MGGERGNYENTSYIALVNRGGILFAAVAWSFSVLFFHVISTSATRAQMQLKANLNPIHLGYQNEAVSLAKPGIPFQPNSAQKIGGKDLSEWLQQSQETKSEMQSLRELSTTVGNEADVRFQVLRLSNDVADTVFPALSRFPSHVILVIAIPPDGTSSQSAPGGAESGQPVFQNPRLEAIPAFGTWSSEK